MDKEHRYMPLIFQESPDYQPPVYPSEKDKQQQMLHLDFYTEQNKLEEEIQHALDCGAIISDVQYSEDWKVLIDPSGHPFCIIPIPSDMMYKKDET